jgi:hypothetical protein
MREASHIACVGCHRSLINQNEAAGPVECAGCHDAGRQATIEKIDDVPRLQMYQPSAAFVRTQAERGGDKTGLMSPVPFDHEAHETYNDTCRVCHHASLRRCVGCHRMPAGGDGSRVNLEEAMHRSGAESSCVGCHEQKQTENACIGCHGFMSKTRQMPQTYCSTCHLTPPSENTASGTEQPSEPSAADMLAARTPMTDTYDMADIPETVTIEPLSKTYEPVELPHRIIVSTLMNGIENSKLAAYFHTQRGTLCQGCHHNSPASPQPPRCISCHDKPFQESALFRPGLMGAYHQQCMGCHDRMGIENPASRDCTGCHQEKQQNMSIPDSKS